MQTITLFIPDETLQALQTTPVDLGQEMLLVVAIKLFELVARTCKKSRQIFCSFGGIYFAVRPNWLKSSLQSELNPSYEKSGWVYSQKMSNPTFNTYNTTKVAIAGLIENGNVTDSRI